MQFLWMLKRFVRWCRAEYLARKDPVAYARSLGVRIGEGSRIFTPERAIFGSEPYLVSLGNNCFIAEGVRFITHDGAAFVLRDSLPDIDVVAPICVGNNVFIGMRAVILPGVNIGDNCIIGAGAVVSHDVPNNSVAAGVPAKTVKTIQEYTLKAIPRSIGTGSLIEKASILKQMFPLAS